MGTVFMDTDNKKDFSDRLTWLFGHARGSKVADNRMFNDVNFYDNQEFSISTSMLLLLKHLSVSSTMKQWAWLLYQRRLLSIGLASMEIRTLQIS